MHSVGGSPAPTGPSLWGGGRLHSHVAAPGHMPGTGTMENLQSHRTPGQDDDRRDEGLSRQGFVAYFSVFIA